MAYAQGSVDFYFQVNQTLLTNLNPEKQDFGKPEQKNTKNLVNLTNNGVFHNLF